MTEETQLKTDDVMPPTARDLPEGTPLLRSIYLYATTGCNLCCRHCWITPTFVNGEPSAGDCIDLDRQEGHSKARPDLFIKPSHSVSNRSN